jgi:hypothetical protein
MQLTRPSCRLLGYRDAPSTHGRSSSACQRRNRYSRGSFRQSTEYAMRKVLRGYAKDRNGNLILIGTIAVPHSKDKPSPRERHEKAHLVSRAQRSSKKIVSRLSRSIGAGCPLNKFAGTCCQTCISLEKMTNNSHKLLNVSNAAGRILSTPTESGLAEGRT